MDGRKAQLRRFYEAFNRQDVDGLMALLHPDADFLDQIDGGRVVGRAALLTYWQRVFDLIVAEVVPIAIARTADDGMVVHSRHHVTNHDNQLWDEGEERLRFDFQDGLIVRMDRAPDTE